MAKIVSSTAKCSWSDFKVLAELENGRQELQFEVPDEKDPKKKNEEAEDHLQHLIGNKKKAQDFDDWGFGKATASGSAAAQACTADSKALRALENCESLVAGKTVSKDSCSLLLFVPKVLAVKSSRFWRKSCWIPMAKRRSRSKARSKT